MKIFVAVLAGGKSSRMGRDKAAMPLRGESLLLHVCRAAKEADMEVIVVGKHPGDSLLSKLGGIAAYPDETPGIGPIGGLLTALRHVPGDNSVLLVACDLPCIGPQQFTWLADTMQNLENPSAKGLVPVWEGQLQPLFAIYRKSLIALATQQVEQKQYSLHALIEKAALPTIPLPPEHVPATMDVDTPEQYQSVIDSFHHVG